jgi:hypothetical protein
MKKKLVILTLIIAITVVFLGLTQSIYAQENKPLMKQKMLPCKSGEFREMMDKRLKGSPDRCSFPNICLPKDGYG